MTMSNPDLRPAQAGSPVGAAGLLAEDGWRADLYDLLAAFLANPPSAELLSGVAELEGDADTALGKAVSALATLAGKVSVAAATREYDALFIGLGRGEVLPYASFYMTGFLNEQPLARLRSDMARLRIARAEDVHEPEDGLASLMEMMAGLIRGRFAGPVQPAAQKEFFNTHIAPWAVHAFADLEAARSSLFYAPLGTVGKEFMAIESETFRLVG